MNGHRKEEGQMLTLFIIELAIVVVVSLVLASGMAACDRLYPCDRRST